MVEKEILPTIPEMEQLYMNTVGCIILRKTERNSKGCLCRHPYPSLDFCGTAARSEWIEKFWIRNQTDYTLSIIAVYHVFW